MDSQKNVWYDHGMGLGGTIIDLMMHLEGDTDMARVLERIGSVLGDAPQARQVVVPTIHAPAEKKASPIIETVGRIEDKVLEAYVQTRGIPMDLARLYLQEVAYRVGEHRYRALGFANDAGGFEVRNANFKGSLGHKDISYLPLPGSGRAAVFEGFFDFLSVLAHYRKDRAEANVLVFNSMALIERGVSRLQTAQVDKLYAYLDHDSAGEKGLMHLREQTQWQLVDASSLYAGHKDANAFWA